MKDRDTSRQAYVLKRGRYDMPGEPVIAGTPAFLMSYPDSLPANRMGLAQWLTHRNHPLTARVAVNRYWQLMFGRGIVATSDDFGNQGALPTHPELLDWLAVSFRESGWDTKALLKTMAMSATYRQSSDLVEDLEEVDPDNLYLARAPRYRLPAEMIRDQALAVSGLLTPRLGGPSVKPYQPEGLWKEKIGGGGGTLSEYVPDTGESLYRRSPVYLLETDCSPSLHDDI